MKQWAVALILSLATGGAFAQAGNKKADLKEITDGKFRQITTTGEMRSLPDGEHYTAVNPERSMIIEYAYRTGNPVDTLFNANTARECTFDTFDGYTISPTGHHILVWRETEPIYRRSWKADVYEYDVRRNYVKPLTEADSKQMIPTFSPDGRMCAYVRDNNIWLKKFDFDTESPVTEDGAPGKILNGITDWVYEEEFAVTNLMAWSPDSKQLAFVRFDESEVPEYVMQVFGKGLYPGVYKFKYPKAGEPNSKVTVHAYSVETKDIKPLQVPLDPDGYIPLIKFTANPDQLAVMTLNRNQNLFNMYYANPKSGVSRLILREENDRYIDSDLLKTITFNENGFTCISEQNGYAHIYQYSPTGVKQRQVTQGNWDVTRLIGVDAKTNTVYYESAEESPMRRAVYKTDAKGNKTKLSAQTGTNSADFSANFAYYVNRYSNAATPMTISVHDAKGKTLRVLQDNAVLKERLKQYAYGNKEFLSVKTKSGSDLNAWMVKPADFDPAKKYPLLMVQYSGPNSQQVLDQYGFDWEHYLAANGIIVACVDGRGTGARGEEFRKCTYLKMGLLESQDQIEAAHALGALPYIDGDRMAIWGWSFGGYNTLMALSRGDGTFKAGIAVAPPTDWKLYDSVYTERFMRTPQQNPDGYAATSPVNLAKDLQGKLLLVHGTADDNVHFQNSMAYIDALVDAGKEYRMLVYPDRNHGIYGGNSRYHLYTNMAAFLFENL